MYAFPSVPHKRWACALHACAVLFAEQCILEIVPDQKVWSLYFLALHTFTQVFHGGHSSVPPHLPTPSLWAQRCIPRAQTDGPLAAAAVNALCTCAFWDKGHRQGGTCSYTSSSHPRGLWECLCVCVCGVSTPRARQPPSAVLAERWDVFISYVEKPFMSFSINHFLKVTI